MSDSEITSEPISVENLLDEINPTDHSDLKGDQEFERAFRPISEGGQAEWIHLRGLEDHYAQKGIWSYFLMFILGVMTVFQCVLLGMVGSGHWDFTQYDWLLPLLLVQNLAQIVGLSTFAVQALFKRLTERNA
jgi:hypothetical protein